MDKTIVFLGSQKSGSSRDALIASKKMGYHIILLTDNPSQYQSRFTYVEIDKMILCRLNDFDEAKKIIDELMKNYDIQVIISFVEPHCHMASRLAKSIGKECFTTEAIEKIQHKIKSRESIKDLPYAPWFKVIHKTSDLSQKEMCLHLPFILKNPVSAGSKEVFFIQSYEHYQEITSQLWDRTNQSLLIEDFLNGPQYLVEVIVNQGKVKLVAIIEQEIEFLNGHFIILGYQFLTQPNALFLYKLKTAVEVIVKAHGLKTGPCHLEIRLVNGQFKLVEINARISGGAMNEIIHQTTGINLVKETLNLALAEPLDLVPKFIKPTFTQYIVVSKKGKLRMVYGKKNALESLGVARVFIKARIGNIVVPPTSLSHRYGYVIAKGKTGEEAKYNAKLAASKIHFVIE